MKNVRVRVPLTTLAIAALALYVFGKWSQSQGAESGAIIQSSRNALAAGKAYRAQVATLAALAQAAAQSGRTWRAKAEAAAPAARQLEATLAEAATVRDSNVALVHQVGFYQGQARFWEESSHAFERAARADSTRAVAAEDRAADLERHVAAVLTVADCRVLGVTFLPRCPSRNVAFVLGAGVTVVAFVVTRR